MDTGEGSRLMPTPDELGDMDAPLMWLVWLLMLEQLLLLVVLKSGEKSGRGLLLVHHGEEDASDSGTGDESDDRDEHDPKLKLRRLARMGRTRVSGVAWMVVDGAETRVGESSGTAPMSGWAGRMEEDVCARVSLSTCRSAAGLVGTATSRRHDRMRSPDTPSCTACMLGWEEMVGPISISHTHPAPHVTSLYSTRSTAV